ncbi:M61 family metallopeptidase [Sphingomonas glaciei]|uniref:Peptidase M61 n=1 Tax=Sphingomonas glaciei TaxID=2938948 RepID=A0ABY5MXV5_9SPHN|nr:peptidase M61 [Sphingomonas glaciei]UUR07186.1 peptidase M61 [Sphingomonas glaciei]
MRSLFLAAALVAASPALAQVVPLSAPQPLPIVQTIPAARDIPYPGTMRLEVDASDLRQGIWTIRQTIPVAQAGRMTLLFPQWLPGNHAPRGEIDKLAGLTFTAGGQKLRWKRDPVDVFAFHLDVPAGAGEVEARFQFLTPTDGAQGRILVTPDMLNVQWEDVSLYPAGYFTRRIPVSATVTYPAGFQAATALRPTATAGTRVTYNTVSYETLQDSPVFAGRYFRRDDLGQNVFLNTIADSPKELVVPADVLQKHRNLVTQSLRLFGTRQFDHYDFLHAITDKLGGIGLEHHRSSENQNDPGYFTDWKASLPDHNLLPHEFTHSWNGKHRRPADLFTPDFRTPMRDSLLWVYEGQTQFWGHVLEARSGLSTKAEVIDKLANIAAGLNLTRGREWRPLVDTTNDPIISARRPKAWPSWQRSEDYYNEGMLVWLEADAIIRGGTANRRGMDDFARAFFGTREGDWGVRTYTLDEVVATLNSVYRHDWRSFLQARVYEPSAEGAPLAGFTRSGYRLDYAETPNAALAASMKSAKNHNYSWSLGLTLDKDGKITAVIWDGPAFKAGLTVGQTIVAVGEKAYSEDALMAAITAAKGGSAPIPLTVKRGESIRAVPLSWNGGLRYPRLTKTGGGRGALDILLEPK